MEHTKAIQLQQGRCISSYDVEVLFTFVPVDPAISIIKNKLQTHHYPTGPSPPTELISLRPLPPVVPLALIQPYDLLSKVECTLSLGHHRGSAWNHAIAYEAHERGNLLSVFEPCSFSTL